MDSSRSYRQQQFPTASPSDKLRRSDLLPYPKWDACFFLQANIQLLASWVRACIAVALVLQLAALIGACSLWQTLRVPFAQRNAFETGSPQDEWRRVARVDYPPEIERRY